MEADLSGDKGNDRNDKVAVQENKEYFCLEEEKKGFHFFEIDFTDKSTVVTLPRDHKCGLDLNASSGGVELTDITGADIKIRAEVTSGSCNLTDLDSGSRDLNVKATSVNIKIDFLD